MMNRRSLVRTGPYNQYPFAKVSLISKESECGKVGYREGEQDAKT